jgi:hypothetical protein
MKIVALDSSIGKGARMRHAKYMSLGFAAATFSSILVNAQEVFPEKMLRNAECLKSYGLTQGTVTDVIRGEAHFALYFRETGIGARVPSIRYNTDFVEGRLKVSPDIIKTCNPNAVLRKVD